MVPQEVIEDQQVIRLEEALRNVSSVTLSGDVGGRGEEFSIRGFENAPVLQDRFRRYGSFDTFPEVANLEGVEVLIFPLASVATGEQRSRGVELDVTGEILPGWNIIAAYAYIDAEVTADTDPNIVGNRLFNIPKHSASLWTTYEIQNGNLQGLGFGVGFNYVGERQGDLLNSFEANSYFLTNTAIFYRRDNWRFALNFKNLFDIDYIEAVVNSRSSGNSPGEAFTVIGSFSVQF